MNRLLDRKALIIGSATGIGASVSRLFAQEGADVALADLPSQTAKHELVAEISKLGRRAVALDVDATDAAQITGVIDAAIAAFGHLDILVVNAGTGTPAHPFSEDKDSDWQRTVAVNFMGVAVAMRHVLPHMVGRRYGRIINTASQLAHKPSPGNAMYCATKAAVVALTASVAQEVAADGVTINAVCPGPTDTPMWRASDPEWNKWKISTLPARRIGTPEEIAWAYVYLASDEATYMVGQSVSPNGGDVMW